MHWIHFLRAKIQMEYGLVDGPEAPGGPGGLRARMTINARGSVIGLGNKTMQLVNERFETEEAIVFFCGSQGFGRERDYIVNQRVYCVGDLGYLTIKGRAEMVLGFFVMAAG